MNQLNCEYEGGCLVYRNYVIDILSQLRHLRACIIISFSIQAFLTIFAPLRKYRGGKWGIFFRFLIWLAYLLADWIAIFTIGTISLITLIRRFSESYDLQIFWLWAPFLLLYLGGPDTITAFALQDNELWLRNLLGLIFQVGSTLYVFIESFSENKLGLPTLLVLIAGIIKYAERIYAFYLASFDHFGDNWVRRENLDLPIEEGTTSTDRREERTARTDHKEGAAGLRIPVQFKNLRTSDSLHKLPENNIHQYLAASNSESIVKAAVYLFGTIRRPLVGSPLYRAQLRNSFANLGSQNKDGSAKEVLQKIEIELSLLYEVLYTKWPVVVSKFGFLCRAFNIGCIVGAIVLFSLYKQARLERDDIWLTYGLFIGALALDFISLILLFVLSDWFFIARFHKKGSKSVENFINRRRWSKRVSQLNFITYVVKDHPSWVKKCLSLSYPSWMKRWAKRCLSWVKKWLSLFSPRWVKKCLPLSYASWAKECISWEWVRVKMFLSLSSQNLREDTYWRFIFHQVESFSKISTRKKKEEVEESFSEERPILIKPNINVDWFTMIIDILEDIDREKPLECLFEDPAQNGTTDNLRSIIWEYDFTRSLLIFHIATELFLQDGPPTPSSSSGSNDHRGTCKILSDYMFYLAMMKPTMLAPILDSWAEVFGDTFEETKSLLDQSSSEKNACTKILSDDWSAWKQKRKEDSKGSVLILAQKLAQELKNRYCENGNDLWEMLSRVWVYLLAHAASNCRPNVHAQQPRKGGELLTFIWLCIAHFGQRTQ